MLIENDRTVLESTVWGSPNYQPGDEISYVMGYRKGIHPSKLPVRRFRVLSVSHLIRRVEQPNEVMHHEFCLQVRVEAAEG